MGRLSRAEGVAEEYDRVWWTLEGGVQLVFRNAARHGRTNDRKAAGRWRAIARLNSFLNVKLYTNELSESKN